MLLILVSEYKALGNTSDKSRVRHLCRKWLGFVERLKEERLKVISSMGGMIFCKDRKILLRTFMLSAIPQKPSRSVFVSGMRQADSILDLEEENLKNS